MRPNRPLPWPAAWARWGCVWLAALLAGAAWADERAADPPENGETELRIKAAYLYKFGAFVAWPDRAFSNADAPVVIGVFEADALADELALVVGGRNVQGRGIVVRKLHRPDAVTGVHVLFVGQRAEQRVSELLALVRALPILTVLDTGLDGPSQAMIRFVTVAGRLRFDVSPRAAEQAHLGISARLLAVAHRVLDATAP